MLMLPAHIISYPTRHTLQFYKLKFSFNQVLKKNLKRYNVIEFYDLFVLCNLRISG